MSSSDSKRGSVVPLMNYMKKQKNFDKCLFCQIDYKKVTLTSTENGRKHVIETSVLLKRDTTDNQQSFVYHLKCYRPYILKGERRKAIEADRESKNDQETVEASPQKRQKRNSKKQYSTVAKNKSLCIICNRSKCKGTTDVFRICENERAQSFLDATKYNLNEVYTKTSTLNTIQDVFPSDVYCHKLCINNYL